MVKPFMPPRFLMFACWLCLLLFATNIYAQDANEVKGVIKDGKQIPVAFATIIEKGTNNGTHSKEDGSFTIKVANLKSAVLVVSIVGYTNREVAVDGKATLNIIMQDKSELDNVVVIGYGNTTQKQLSNSVVTISGKDIEDLPVASPAEAMVGRAAGVLVGTPSGEPGSNPWIRVRGLGSLGAGNSPLFVVDGFPLNNADNFYNINSQDIQSIQVMKDAASSAIYGSRGGNGIVMVTTKRGGNGGKTRYAANVYTGIQQVSKKIDLMDGAQFTQFIKDAYENAGQKAPAVYYDSTAKLANTDWQDQVFRTGIQNNYSLSASGGTDASKFYISGNYFKQKGVVEGTGFDRILLRANYDAVLSKKLKIGMTVAPSFSTLDTRPISGSFNSASIANGGPSNVGAAITDALLLPPTLGVTLPNGDYAQATNTPVNVSVGGLFNPVATLNLYQDKTKTFRGLGYSFLEYQLVKGLTYRTNIGGEVVTNERNWYVPATLATNSASTANFSTPILANINARQQDNTSYSWLWENLLTYTATVKDHRFTVLAGYGAQKNTYQATEAFGQNGTYTNSALNYVTAAGQIFGTATANANTLVSAFGRVDYNYKYKYIVSASFRNDGSSRFGDNNKYANFPAVSVAWRAIDEKFLSFLKRNSFSELKLRASYGRTGNLNIGNYSWQNYLTPANYVLGTNAGNLMYGLSPSGIRIPDLTWENNTQMDLGLEVAMFKNRIYLTAEWYQRNTSSLLLNRNVPSVIGYTNRTLTNVGEVRNNGLELSLTTQNIKSKNFSWTTNANFFLNRNKVLSLSGPGDQILFDAVFGYTSSIRAVTGQPMGSFYGYKQTGVYKNAEDVENSAKWAAGGSAPGDIKYADINGDGKIDAGDITYLGNAFPDFSYGMANSFQYKNFSLSIAVQGSIGCKVLNGVDRYVYNFYGRTNATVDYVDRWRSEAEPGDGRTPRVTVNVPSSLTSFSSNELYDASYFRIRTVQLRYFLPKQLLSKAKIQSLSVYVMIQNLYTFASYKGYNPEANLYGNSVNPTYGVDQGSYPLSRTTTIGFNLGF